MERVVTAAIGTGCQALHPGYGFLGERAGLARMCAQNGIVFIGPSGDAIEAMGDKLQARKIAAALGVPTVPGTDGVGVIDDVLEFGPRADYPFLLKASAGGGGRTRGHRRCLP